MPEWKVFTSILQLILMILDKKLEKDKSIRTQKEARIAELKEAIAARDASRVNALFDLYRRL